MAHTLGGPGIQLVRFILSLYQGGRSWLQCVVERSTSSQGNKERKGQGPHIRFKGSPLMTEKNPEPHLINTLPPANIVIKGIKPLMYVLLAEIEEPSSSRLVFYRLMVIMRLCFRCCFGDAHVKVHCELWQHSLTEEVNPSFFHTPWHSPAHWESG